MCISTETSFDSKTRNDSTNSSTDGVTDWSASARAQVMLMGDQGMMIEISDDWWINIIQG
tara:strand:- start:759 stop:938 length:180 start_codon:yes stop_codon:yes gene_type:complete